SAIRSNRPASWQQRGNVSRLPFHSVFHEASAGPAIESRTVIVLNRAEDWRLRRLCIGTDGEQFPLEGVEEFVVHGREIPILFRRVIRIIDLNVAAFVLLAVVILPAQDRQNALAFAGDPACLLGHAIRLLGAFLHALPSVAGPLRYLCRLAEADKTKVE